MNSDGLSALADATAAATGGAVAVMDPHGYVVAYSSLPGQQIDDVRRDGILGKRVPDKYLVHHQDPDFRSSSAVHLVDVAGTLPRLAVAVNDASSHLGSIWVIMAPGSVGPPEPAAIAAMVRAADLAVPLLRPRSSPGEHGSDRVRRLLTGAYAPSDTRFVVVAVASARDAETALIGMLDLTLALGSNSGSAVVDGTLYCLCAIEDPRGSTADLVSEVDAIRQRAVASLAMTVTMGISDVCVRPDEARIQARRVLDLVAGESRTATFAQVEVRLRLSDAQEALADVPLAISAVEEMLAHDTREGTAYGATVLALLANESNVAVASASLYLHANTFRYRIRRTKELFGLELDDADTRLLVWMALRFSS